MSRYYYTTILTVFGSFFSLSGSGDIMISLFRKELNEMYSFFKNNYTETVVLCMATLFLVLERYHLIGSSLVVSRMIYYAILPFLTILIILRKNYLLILIIFLSLIFLNINFPVYAIIYRIINAEGNTIRITTEKIGTHPIFLDNYYFCF